jgi:hypothetical protein
MLALKPKNWGCEYTQFASLAAIKPTTLGADI